MKTILLKNYRHGDKAFLWVEAGEGYFDQIKGIDRDWRVKGQGSFWCSLPSTSIVLLERDETIEPLEKEFQKILKKRRKVFSSGIDSRDWKPPVYIYPGARPKYQRCSPVRGLESRNR